MKHVKNITQNFSLCNCKWKIMQAFLLFLILKVVCCSIEYSLKTSKIKLYLAIYSFSSQFLEIQLFSTAAGCPASLSTSLVHGQSLAARPQGPDQHHLTRRRQQGLLQCLAYIHPSIGVIEYHKCIFSFSPLIKCRGSLFDLFNYIGSFPKYFIFPASPCTDRSLWLLHLSIT